MAASKLIKRIPILVLCTLAAFLAWCFAKTPCAFAADTIEIPFTVENHISGDTPSKTPDFTFVLEAETSGAPMSDSTEVTISGEGSAHFGNIDFANADAGQYQYKIYELQGNEAGWEYDTSVYHILVDVSSYNGKSYTQVVAWEGDVRSETTKVSKLSFTNIFDESVAAASSITVVVQWPGGDEATRPDSVTVKLYKDGVLYDTQVVTAQSGWTYKWENIDRDANWTLEEDPVASGYSAQIELTPFSDDSGAIFTVSHTISASSDDSSSSNSGSGTSGASGGSGSSGVSNNSGSATNSGSSGIASWLSKTGEDNPWVFVAVPTLAAAIAVFVALMLRRRRNGERG